MIWRDGFAEVSVVWGRRNGELSEAEALNVALQALAVFHGYVQQADAKVATVATVHLGFTAVAVTQVGDLPKVWTAGPLLAVATVVVVLLFVAGFLVAGHHLVAALRPRLTGPGGPNRFGLVRNGETPSPVDAVRQRNEVWSLTSTLADIALHKHERVRRSLRWMVLMPVAVVAWLALAALNG